MRVEVESCYDTGGDLMNSMKNLMRMKYITINGKKVRLQFIEDMDDGVYHLTIWEEEE